MTIDQIISLATSIAAFIAAAAAFLVVLQVSKQRADSYKPALVVARTRFICSQPDDGVIPHTWSNPDSIDNGAVQAHAAFSLPLVNVGLGAAIDVKVSWAFPIDEVVRLVNELAQKSLIAVYFDWNNEILSINADKPGRTVHNWASQKESNFDFVLPASIDQNANSVTIPMGCVHLVSALVYVTSKLEKFESFPKIPSLLLKIAYSDIAGTKYSTQLSISIEVVAMHSGDGFKCHGIIESSRTD